MGGCASKPKEYNGQVPEELAIEAPATIGVTHKSADAIAASEIIIEAFEKGKETKEEEPLVDLSEPKKEKAPAIEVTEEKVNATDITDTIPAAAAAAATATVGDESSTKVDAGESKQEEVVEEEEVNQTPASS